jgi:hypothetical protein
LGPQISRPLGRTNVLTQDEIASNRWREAVTSRWPSSRHGKPVCPAVSSPGEFSPDRAAEKPTFRCDHCKRPLAQQMRADAKFCSANCRRARWRRRARTARALAQPHKCETCKRRILCITRRRDTRYCSPACRQCAYRKRKAAAPPRKAHQRIIRERLAVADSTTRTADIRSAQVRAISTEEAATIIEPYEWLGSMPAVSRHCLGIFFDGELGGAVVYGDVRNLGDAADRQLVAGDGMGPRLPRGRAVDLPLQPHTV